MRAFFKFLFAISIILFSSCNSVKIADSLNDLDIVEMCLLQKEAEVKGLKQIESTQETKNKIELLQVEISVLEKTRCELTTKLFGKNCSETCGGTGCCNDNNGTNKYICEATERKGKFENGGGCNYGEGCDFPDINKTGWYINLTKSLENVQFFNKNGNQLKVINSKIDKTLNSELRKFENLNNGDPIDIVFSVRIDNNELKTFTITNLNLSK